MSQSSIDMAGRISALERQLREVKTQSKRFPRMQCVVYRNSNQSIVTGGAANISFSTADYDPNGMFVIGTPTIVTLPVEGFWSIHGGVRFASTGVATGVRQVSVTAGGLMLDVTRVPSIAGEAVIIGSTAYRYLAAGTQISLQVRHTFGANLDIEFVSPYSPYLQLALMS